MAVELRGITDDEREAFLRAVFLVFGIQPTEEQLADEQLILETDRSIAGFDDGQVVCSASACSFSMTVPGGATLPVAAVTSVGVHPTHRRQGLLRSMMARQLDDVVARGEVLAVLTASEAGIYGRFGYGLAARLQRVAIDTSGGLPLWVEPAVGGRLRLVPDPAEHRGAAADVYDRVRRTRVGEMDRTDRQWTYVERDPEAGRGGASARFCVVHEADDGAVDGCCWYRVKRGSSDDGVARWEVVVLDLVGDTAEVEAALLVYLAGIDLTTSITGVSRPVDDPWPLRLADSRRYRVQLVKDHLYLRVLDVPAALAARTYEGAGTLVLDVDDPFRPGGGGRFRLVAADDGTATCERLADVSGGPADDPLVRLDAAALGSLYLGDVAPSTLADAGRLVPSGPDALRLADRILTSARSPFCTADF